jgi:hypothetical protein
VSLTVWLDLRGGFAVLYGKCILVLSQGICRNFILVSVMDCNKERVDGLATHAWLLAGLAPDFSGSAGLTGGLNPPPRRLVVAAHLGLMGLVGHSRARDLQSPLTVR